MKFPIKITNMERSFFLMFTNFSNMKGPCLEVGVCVYKLIVRSVWGNRCFVFELLYIRTRS